MAWNKRAYGHQYNKISGYGIREKKCIVCGKNLAVKGKYCPSCAQFLRKTIQRKAK